MLTKTTGYDRAWCERTVEVYRDSYPRAFNIATEMLKVSWDVIINALQKHPESWERFKRIVKITNNWLVSYGDVHLRDHGAGGFLRDIEKILIRERLLYRRLVLTDPWNDDLLMEHVPTKGGCGPGTLGAQPPSLFLVQPEDGHALEGGEDGSSGNLGIGKGAPGPA